MPKQIHNEEKETVESPLETSPMVATSIPLHKQTLFISLSTAYLLLKLSSSPSSETALCFFSFLVKTTTTLFQAFRLEG
ncbi:hypothetical protein RchiOBHm_Chr2g0174491 [Rosa chinensis]|uniref:Uncharacterized protein n=1 Tax=Rosa chinensis TaxID=74649 RepID=A0A2P6S663_ROSCH|nr:hypothetical protein RchiOBHm_Chr2g0174491 [Rosa chinensis]